MKRILLIAAAVIGLTALTAFAQMGGGTMGGQGKQQGGMMGSQSQQMMGNQMMSQDMMHDMSGMMKQMSEMMQKLSHPMGHLTVTEHGKMQDMGKIMHEMAAQMNEMAAHMERGKLDQGAVKKMHEKMQSLNHDLDDMQKNEK
jgi:methyl-accepting chemotaxis protein